MYRITDSTLKSNVYSALTAQTREFCHRLSFGEGVGVNFSEQISFEKGITKTEISQEGNNDSSGLVFGSCCASSAVAEFYNPNKAYSYNGKTMFVECGVKLADGSIFYIPCGYYKVDKPETDDDWHTVKVTAYDSIDRMTAKWNTSLSFPSTAYLLVEELATKYALELDIESGVLKELQNRTITESEALILTAYTEREVLGFLVGLVAANARVNTVGKLAVGRFQYYPEEVFEIPPRIQWQNGFKKTAEEEFVINSVTSGVDDAVFTAGTGAGITFANPIITEDEIAEIYDTYAGMSFQPSSCEWRGNPCIECGDTVFVSDKNGNVYVIFVARQDIDLTGGLSMTTHCPSGDADISFDTVDERTRTALNRQYTRLQQAIIDASNAINGSLGGYFEILDSDSDGNPDGWLIKQNQDGSGGLIRANSEGIGFSEDGGKTYRTAITYKGINADCITTGKLNAELIDTSTLVVGGNNYEGLDSLLNAVVDTANSSITKVDVLYGKNQSTSNPPSSWSTDAPVWQNGYYIWTKTQTTAGGEVTETEPVCITGAKGATGADGLGISKIEEQYYLSTSSASVTGGSWSTNQPIWAKDNYIWTRSKITWGDNTVTYTDAVLAKAINGANESANSSKLILDAVTVKENNATVINGAKILTGSIGAVQIAAGAITAEKINVGWQSGNCATNWMNPNGLTLTEYFTIISNSSSPYYDKISLKTDYISGTIRCSTKPFYASAGDVFKYGGILYNKLAKTTGLYLEYATQSDGNSWSVKAYKNKSTTGSQSVSEVYTVQTSGWYRLTYALDNQNSGCYCQDVYCIRSVKGDLIVNGVISSTDGNTYFDLNESEIITKNSSGYSSHFTAAGITSYYQSTEAGGLQPCAITGLSTASELLWFGSVLRIGFGKPSVNDPSMDFGESDIICYKQLKMAAASKGILFTDAYLNTIQLYSDGTSLKCKINDNSVKTIVLA